MSFDEADDGSVVTSPAPRHVPSHDEDGCCTTARLHECGAVGESPTACSPEPTVRDAAHAPMLSVDEEAYVSDIDDEDDEAPELDLDVGDEPLCVLAAAEPTSRLSPPALRVPVLQLPVPADSSGTADPANEEAPTERANCPWNVVDVR